MFEYHVVVRVDSSECTQISIHADGVGAGLGRYLAHIEYYNFELDCHYNESDWEEIQDLVDSMHSLFDVPSIKDFNYQLADSYIETINESLNISPDFRVLELRGI